LEQNPISGAPNLNLCTKSQPILKHDINQGLIGLKGGTGNEEMGK